MRIGLALPHYDFSLMTAPSGRDAAPQRPALGFDDVVSCARRAEALGFHSLWVSDHLSLSIARYGGGDGEHFAFEPLTTLAALARQITRPRLGTLVLCEALRPAAVLAKAIATLDHLCAGRLDVGLGAGWYEPDYDKIGLSLPRPGERLRRLEEALAVLDGLLRGGPFTFEGQAHRARDAVNRPAARQSPRPPLLVGGKGDRLLRLVARRADAWNTCWVWTPEAYRERVAALDRACEDEGRDPATIGRSLGLYALAGEDDGDLAARYERMRRHAPKGMLDGVSLSEWRTGRLVGTVDQVAEQLAAWEDLGVGEVIVGAGPLPFSIAAADDLDLLAAAAGLDGASGR